MRLTERFPQLQPLAVFVFRTKRYLSWMIGRTPYASVHVHEELPFRVARHQSVLMRKLGNADMRLQKNKITNLTLATQRVTKITIRPGETFSLWKLVGHPTAKKGYVEGLLLSNGEVAAGVGGGLCQMANLLYWMFLHSPLIVTERHHHSFDAFPDSGRVLPFGTGATLFYNYVDLQCKNPTNHTFQIVLWMTDEHLKGEIRCDAELPERYHVFERDHAFIFRPEDQKYYRTNKIYRDVNDAKTGALIREEFVMENFSEMKYELPKGTEILIQETVHGDVVRTSVATIA